MKLPKKWSDITIEKFIEIQKHLTISSDEIDDAIKLIALLSGVNETEIQKMNCNQLVNQYRSLAFLHEMPKGKLSATFKIKGVIYKAALSFDEMSAAQYIDFVSIANQKTSAMCIENMHNLIACMCSRKTKGIYLDKQGLHFSKWYYDGYDKYASIFLKEMSMSIAYVYYSFFLKTFLRLPDAMLNSLRSYLRKEIKIKSKENGATKGRKIL